MPRKPSNAHMIAAVIASMGSHHAGVPMEIGPDPLEEKPRKPPRRPPPQDEERIRKAEEKRERKSRRRREIERRQQPLELIRMPHRKVVAVHKVTRDPLYVRDLDFSPRVGSIYSKPSFAGRQVQLGIVDGKPLMSNGVWFVYEGLPFREEIQKADG